MSAPFDATDAERLDAWLIAHSENAIGRVWTVADHYHLVAYLGAIEVAVAELQHLG